MANGGGHEFESTGESIEIDGPGRSRQCPDQKPFDAKVADVLPVHTLMDDMTGHNTSHAVFDMTSP